MTILLTGATDGVDLEAANCNLEGGVDINDVTVLINYLLKGSWP